MNTYEIHTESFSCTVQADSLLEAIGKFFTEIGSTFHTLIKVEKIK